MNSSRCTLSLLRVGGWLLLFPLVLASACVQVDCANGDLSCNPLALAAYLRTPDPDCLVRGQLPTEGWLGFSGENAEDDFGEAICGLPDGRIVVAGTYNASESRIQGVTPQRPYSGTAAPDANLGLHIYDEFGQLERYALFGGPGSSISSHRLAIAPDGSIYVVASASGGLASLAGLAPLSAYNGGATDLIVMRFTSDLRLVWYRYIGSTGSDAAGSVTLADDSSLLIGASSDTAHIVDGLAPLNAYAGGRDAVIYRLHPDGRALWMTFVGSTGAELSASVARVNIEPRGSGLSSAADQFVVAMTAGGDIPLLGGLSPFRAYTSGRDIVYLRFDRSGSVLRYGFYGDTGDQTPQGVLSMRGGDTVITATTDQDLHSIDGVARLGAYVAGKDTLLLRLDAAGQIRHFRIIGSVGVDNPTPPVETPDASVWFGANLNSSVNDSLSPLPHGGANDATAIRVGPTGDVLSFVYYGSASSENANGLAPTFDSGAVITGEASGSGFTPTDAVRVFDPATVGSSDFFTLRIFANGRTVP